MLECSNPDCEQEFGYDAGLADPSEGSGHISVAFNPIDEPGYVTKEERFYCSTGCFLDDTDNHPFAGGDD